MQIAVEADEDDRIRETLVAGMIAFNREAIGVEPGGKFAVTIRGEDGAVNGGVWVRMSGDTAYFDIVYLDAPLRRGGHGSKLLRAAEEEARRRGATTAWLYTTSWQARPFYEKHGFVCIGEMPMIGGKHRRQFMWKQL